MVEIKKRSIVGDNCTVATYDGKMRFWVRASFYAAPKDAESIAEKNRMAIDKYPDGSATVCVQTMVAWDTSDACLEELYEETLNHIEKTLGISEGELSSSEWNTGHNDTLYDHLLTDEEMALVESH